MINLCNRIFLDITTCIRDERYLDKGELICIGDTTCTRHTDLLSYVSAKHSGKLEYFYKFLLNHHETTYYQLPLKDFIKVAKTFATAILKEEFFVNRLVARVAYTTSLLAGSTVSIRQVMTLVSATEPDDISFLKNMQESHLPMEFLIANRFSLSDSNILLSRLVTDLKKVYLEEYSNIRKEILLNIGYYDEFNFEGTWLEDPCFTEQPLTEDSFKSFLSRNDLSLVNWSILGFKLRRYSQDKTKQEEWSDELAQLKELSFTEQTLKESVFFSDFLSAWPEILCHLAIQEERYEDYLNLEDQTQGEILYLCKCPNQYKYQRAFLKDIFDDVTDMYRSKLVQETTEL